LGLNSMTEDDKDDDRHKADRRSFLEQCGRFAVVTPPVVTLMLATDSTKKALAASGTKTVTLATTTTATTTAATTFTNDTTTFTTTTVTTTLSQLDDPSRNSRHGNSQLAMMVDSMGVMKPS
jgi:hypothetical protein